ncbi:protein kinase and PP2C-like domain-containing protein isoform X4 [Lolium perenne]|uniref:protein kinase and PP2C-like domain-containing protein isoform X4 n=1 Tax=Lolium perenne TaxID=4522 RepID=UPI003A99B7D2
MQFSRRSIHPITSKVNESSNIQPLPPRSHATFTSQSPRTTTPIEIQPISHATERRRGGRGGCDGSGGAAGGVQPVRARVLPQRRHPAPPTRRVLLPSLPHRASKLDHPGLAKLIAAHARPPNYLMFFEFFEPPNLADKIHVEEWSPSIQQVVNIASYLAKTLEYLQILGIVHRDIKPANILLDKDLLPRLADFGLAMYQKDIKSVSVENWKSSGKPTGGFYKKNMVGTLIYMAPEILRKDLHTEKSDVYSFAISVNELLTGVVPYTDLRAEAQAHTVLEMTYTEQQLTSAVVSQGLRPALALPESGSPPSLLSLIQRCWDPDPKQRPSFEDIIQELNAIQKHLVTYSCPPSSCSVNMSQTGNAEVHHYQETLNWFNQGELFAKKANKLEHTVNPWSDSFDQSSVSMYRPTLSWGSFATCGRRETMEDTHFMLPCMSEEKDVHSFGIFDGHRGAAAAEFSVRAVPGFLKQFGHTSPTDTLVEAFMKSDTAFREELIIHQKSKRIIQKDWHPGCTAVTALIVRNKLFVANAGDCRAILSRAGKPFPMTRDHVASCAKERERVIKEGTEVRWQIDTWRVGAAALQVMASDGLWDVVGNEDVLSIIRDTVKEPGMCSKRLATEAASRGSKDNITVIVVFLRPVTTAERVY